MTSPAIGFAKPLARGCAGGSSLCKEERRSAADLKTIHARLGVLSGKLCRVEIVDWAGQVLRSFGLNECEGAPHDARIVRRSSLVAALRSAIPPHLIRYGVSVADVHAHEQGVRPVLRSCRIRSCRSF